MLSSQNGGTGFTIAKDSGGFGLSEKRPRDDERYIMHQRGTFIGGDTFAHRSFQDCPEAPLRKRVHVCDSEAADGVQDLSHYIRQTPVESYGVKSPSELNEGKFSPEECGNARPDVVPDVGRSGTNSFPGGNYEGVGASCAEEVETFAGLYQPAPDAEDIKEVRIPLARTEGENLVLEPKIMDMDDMDVDVGSRVNVASEAVRGPLSDGDVAGAALNSRREDMAGGGIFVEADLPNKSGGAGGDGEGEGGGEGEQAQAATGAAADTSFPGNDEHSFRGREPQRDRFQVEQRGVEVIEVEDSDDDDDEPVMEMNIHESDESSTKGKTPVNRRQGAGGDGHRRRGGYRLSTSRSISGSYSPEDDSDSDDCLIMGSHPPREDPVLVEEEEVESDSSSGDDSDSDMEVLGASSQGAIRRMWEEAAMRRRMGRAMRSEGSNANGQQEGAIDLDAEGTESHGLEESVATSTYQGSPDSKDQTETSEARGGLDGFGRQNDFRPETISTRVDIAQAAAASSAVPRDTVIRPDSSRPEDELETPATDASADSREELAGTKSPGFGADDLHLPDLSNGVLHETEEDVNAGTQSNSADWESSPGADPGINDRSHLASGDTGSEQQRGSASAGAAADEEEGTSSPPDQEDFLAAKDKLKQTVHYKKSDAAEWDSRQREIQRQSAETKKLRQRKRQEADRKKEMERKQKERIEELRLSQLKEERNMDIREQLRGQIRERLERIASTCHDYATLLRQLGVAVDGGHYPTQQQVNVAYKKALMKFHPDRAISSVKGDPRQQVEAEEKFKLILRLKDTLAPVPVAHDYMNRNWRYA